MTRVRAARCSRNEGTAGGEGDDLDLRAPPAASRIRRPTGQLPMLDVADLCRLVTASPEHKGPFPLITNELGRSATPLIGRQA